MASFGSFGLELGIIIEHKIILRVLHPQGPVAFTNLYGVFYPAVSLNCNVTLTLRTAIEPPQSDSDNDSGAL